MWQRPGCTKEEVRYVESGWRKSGKASEVSGKWLEKKVAGKEDG